MITKKKKYTLYYVMALACGLVASFFIYSCSADGYYMGHRTKRFFQWSGKMGERF